jgi:monothiol glutaredoxin
MYNSMANKWVRRIASSPLEMHSKLFHEATPHHIRHVFQITRRAGKFSFFLTSLTTFQVLNTEKKQLLRQTARPTTRLSVAPASSLLLRRLLSDQTRQAIDKAVGSAPVVLFMKGTPETPQCGFSRASIQILGMQGVDPDKFAAFNVLEDPELRQGIKEYSDWPTIPQLYIDKEFVGGCDIIVSMHQSGELAKLLDEKRVLLKEEQEAERKEQ